MERATVTANHLNKHIKQKEEYGIVVLTFAILPGCVPGQAEKRREKNNRSGNRSISEPHFISAIPSTTHGDPGLPCLSHRLQDVKPGVGECIWWPQNAPGLVTASNSEVMNMNDSGCVPPVCLSLVLLW